MKLYCDHVNFGMMIDIITCLGVMEATKGRVSTPHLPFQLKGGVTDASRPTFLSYQGWLTKDLYNPN